MALQDVGGVGPSHHPEDVQEIREGGGLPVPRLPQVQDVLRRAGLAGEVVQVPVTGRESQLQGASRQHTSSRHPCISIPT